MSINNLMLVETSNVGANNFDSKELFYEIEQFPKRHVVVCGLLQLRYNILWPLCALHIAHNTMGYVQHGCCNVAIKSSSLTSHIYKNIAGTLLQKRNSIKQPPKRIKKPSNVLKCPKVAFKIAIMLAFEITPKSQNRLNKLESGILRP